MATMKECILEQPETIRQVVQKMPAEVERVLAVVGRQFERILLIGSGSSLNAAAAAVYGFRRMVNADVQVITPFEFLHYYPHSRINEKMLAVGISQTARSTGTIDSVKLCRSLGAKTIFVTAEADAPGADSADVMMDTFTGLEMVGAKTKGYTSTLVALYYLAAGLGQQKFDAAPLVGFLVEVLERTGRQIDALSNALLAAPSATIVSYGPCMGIAKEAALKVKETVRIPVEYYDVEEYMHGPYHCLDENSWLIFLLPEGEGQQRSGALLRFAGEITDHILLITNERFAAEGFHAQTLALPELSDDLLASVGYVIPMQWLANDTTLKKGRRPEVSRYPNFHKILGSKFMPKFNYYTGEPIPEEKPDEK